MRPEIHLLGLFIACALGLGSGVGIPRLASKYRNWRGPVDSRRHEAALWIDASRSAEPDERGHTLRQAMVGDVLERVARPGTARETIRAQLGAPSRWPIFAGASWFGKEDEAWWLGESSSMFRKGCDWLYLDYDASGKLVRAKVASEHAAEEREP